MRKFAMLLAAALVVAAPLVTATSSLTYAAAKAKAKAPAAPKAAPAAVVDPAESNTAFLRALSNLPNGLPPVNPPKGKKGKKA
jgi:hypothetical protein